MAQQVSVQYVDDLDGSAASGPVDFSLDGKGYTIDLSDTNASKLREILTPFVTAARRPSGSAHRPIASPARSSGPSRSRDETQAMPGLAAGERLHRQRPRPRPGRIRCYLRDPHTRGGCNRSSGHAKVAKGPQGQQR